MCTTNWCNPCPKIWSTNTIHNSRDCKIEHFQWGLKGERRRKMTFWNFVPGREFSVGKPRATQAHIGHCKQRNPMPSLLFHKQQKQEHFKQVWNMSYTILCSSGLGKVELTPSMDLQRSSIPGRPLNTHIFKDAVPVQFQQVTVVR